MIGDPVIGADILAVTYICIGVGCRWFGGKVESVTFGKKVGIKRIDVWIGRSLKIWMSMIIRG